MGSTTRGAAALRWGILGTAGIAETVLPAIRASGCGHVAAVASRDDGRARAWADRHGIPQAFGGYDRLLASGAVDVVYIPLPNSLHAEWTIRALEAGLPVLCEKPIAHSAAAARRIAAASEQAGLPVAEAFMYRFHPLYDRLTALLREGRIGALTSIWSQFTFALDDRAEIPASAALAGGALMDVGSYCVNLSRLVCGCEPTRAFAFERRTTVDDTLFGALEFPGGVVAQLECSIENHERHRAEIAGTKGSFLLESPWFPGETEARLRLRLEEGPDGPTEQVITTPGGDGYQLEIEDFARACVTGAAPRWPVADAVGNMAAIDALYAAARSGRAESIGDER